MPYNAEKHRKGWRIVFRYWKSGIRKSRYIRAKELREMGIREDMSVEQVRKRLAIFNNQERVKKEKNRLLAKKAKERIDLVESAFLPREVVSQFEDRVIKPLGIRSSHWKATRKAIASVSIPPKDWHYEPWHFYNWFIKHGYSLDYSHRIRRLINEWGQYLSRYQGTFWAEIPAPSKKWRAKMRNAQRKEPGRNRKAKRLEIEELEEKKKKLVQEQYNYMYISIAFGLRPEEMEKAITDGEYYNIKKEGKVTWLSVYQFKLEREGIDPTRCWKHIPVVEPRQVKALELVKKQNFKEPLNKTLRAVFGKSVTKYSGRQEFWNYMKGKYSPYFVRKWMGHVTGGTAEEHYEDPNDLRYWTG